MRVALVQLAAGQDKAANRAAVRSAVDVAARSRPDLVVLPEAVMHDFGPPGTSLAGVAEPLDGPFVSAVAELARTHRTTVVAGMFEAPGAEEGDLPYNTLVALGPDGTLAATYRKIHLYDGFGNRESERLGAGALGATTIDVGGLRVALMTCYDLRFPELGRLLVDAGAQVLAVPAAWVRGPLKEQHWQTLLAARAIENTVYVVAAAQNGSRYCGLSQVVDPLGIRTAALGDQDGVLVAELDADCLDAARVRNPALLHRRIGAA